VPNHSAFRKRNDFARDLFRSSARAYEAGSEKSMEFFTVLFYGRSFFLLQNGATLRHAPRKLIG
jgi:hypothetical protein